MIELFKDFHNQEQKEKKDKMTTLHKYCPRCQMVDTSTTAIFCTQCGTKLTQQTVCDCGEPIWKHYIHCPNCGKLFIKGQLKSGGEKIGD